MRTRNGWKWWGWSIGVTLVLVLVGLLSPPLREEAYAQFTTAQMYALGKLGWSGSAVTFSSPTRVVSTNSGYWEQGVNTELLTIAAAATTDSSASLLPADSIIQAVVVRVTVVIPTAATFTVGDPTTPARFATGVAVAAGTTAVGLIHMSGASTTLATGPSQVSAAAIRITPNLTPATATGVVRIQVYYSKFVAPIS